MFFLKDVNYFKGDFIAKNLHEIILFALNSGRLFLHNLSVSQLHCKGWKTALYIAMNLLLGAGAS